MKLIPLFLSILISLGSNAQPMPLPYQIQQVPLPEAMNKQVCISGIKYMDGKLYFVSERCPMILVTDPATGAITQTIATSIGQEFEMEGLTSYKSKLYSVSEELVAVYEIDPATGQSKQLSTSVPLPPKSKSGDGMEGIAANETNNKFYILRERNENMTFAQIRHLVLNPAAKTIASV